MFPLGLGGDGHLVQRNDSSVRVDTIYRLVADKYKSRDESRLSLWLATQAYARFFIASSRNSRRRILPTLVFGSSLRNSMNFGRL